MHNFTTQLIAAASISASSGVMAQLPSECFFVTEMLGPNSGEGDLISNLPMLQTMYKPGMQLQSITSLLDNSDADGRVTGLQVDLISKQMEQLQLPIIGAQLDEWESKKMHFKTYQPDSISILTDTELGGVCDVVIYQGNQATYLSRDSSNCLPEEEGIEETIVRLPKDTPLVGFHGRSDGEVLNSLGLILLNATDPMCKKPLHINQLDTYKGSIFEQSEAAEGSITAEQHAKTEALEAIIAYNTIAKARESKLQIQKEIKELNYRQPSNAASSVDTMDSKTRETLLAELNKFEQLESESLEYLDTEYNMQGAEIDEILKAIKNDSRHLDLMQKMILDLDKREQNSSEVVAPKKLPIPHYMLKDQSESENIGAAAKKINMMIEESLQLAKQVRGDTETITNAEQKIEEVNHRVYEIIAATIFAIFIGMALGSCLVLCYLKNYKSNQSQRLQQAGHQNLRFVEGSRAIDMPTQSAQKLTTDNNQDSSAAYPVEDDEAPASGKFQETQVLDNDEVCVEERNNQSVALPAPTMRTLADDDENDFVNVLAARGIAYEVPLERRTTIKLPAKPADRKITRKIQSVEI